MWGGGLGSLPGHAGLCFPLCKHRQQQSSAGVLVTVSPVLSGWQLPELGSTI